MIIKTTKVLLINILILMFVFFLTESFARVALLIYKCTQSKGCYPKRTLGIIVPDPQYGFSTRHSILGYIPKEGFNSIIDNEPGWNNKLVTIERFGIRNSSKQADYISKKQILTVGDSFAFGDQVSNDETWQSCLNLKQNKYNFVNAGVFGYGTGQALVRAKLLSKKISPKTELIFLSHLVGHDFPRERFMYRSGFPVPTIVTENGISEMTLPPDNIMGSKYFVPKTEFENLKYKFYSLLGNSRILAKFAGHYQSIAQKRLNKLHPKAASEQQIKNWITQRSKKNKTKVIWILQYSEKLYKEPEFIAKKRDKLINTLKKNSIEFIDTYSILKNQISKNNNQNEIWDKHHTKFGNELVCREILNSMKVN